MSGLNRQRTSSGFTLIEMMVTIGIITVLLAILLPVLSGVRRSSLEMKSIMEVKGMFETLMHLHVQEHKQVPGWWMDEDLVIHSALHYRVDEEHRPPHGMLPVHGFDVKTFEDPFRGTTIANDPLLSRLGTFVDAEHGEDGRGYFYVVFDKYQVMGKEDESDWSPNSIYHPIWDVHPNGEPRNLDWLEPSWTRLNIPQDTQYLLWGVGKNGKLDGDPALDVVLIKRPDHEKLIRHRPVQAQGPGIGQVGVEEEG